MRQSETEYATKGFSSHFQYGFSTRAACLQDEFIEISPWCIGTNCVFVVRRIYVFLNGVAGFVDCEGCTDCT